MVAEGEPRPSSRRALLRTAGGWAVGAAAALTAAGCGSGTSKTTAPSTALPPPVAAELIALGAALDLEHRIISAYTASVPLLEHRAHAAAKWFLAQELSHAVALASLITHLGGKPAKARPSYDLGHPEGPRELVALLRELENAQVASYVAAVPTLTTPAGRATVASILGAEAQHLAVLGLILGHDPLPSAFVTGHV